MNLTAKSINLVKNIGQSIIFFYLIIFLAIWSNTNFGKTDYTAKLAILNRLRPHFEFHNVFYEYQIPYRQKQLRLYINYFDWVVQFMPDHADAYGMMGLCYHLIGDDKNAIASYKKAIEYNPSFLWSYYNLGLIYFKRGEYAIASELIQRALRTKAQHTTTFILMSEKIYLTNIVTEARGTGKDYKKIIEDQIKEGYLKSYIVLMLSAYHQENYEDVIRVADLSLRIHGDVDGVFTRYAGFAAYQMKAYTQAVYLLNESIHVNPNNSEAFQILGLSLQALGKDDLAQGALIKGKYLKNITTPSIPIENTLELKMY